MHDQKNLRNQKKENFIRARRRAREFALQGIYAWLLNHEESESALIELDLRENCDHSSVDMQWFKILLYGVLGHSKKLRECFMTYTERKLFEVSPVEHSILLISSFELLNHFEIPHKVTINEAIELAKSFGGPEGFRFINGILDKLALDIRS